MTLPFAGVLYDMDGTLVDTEPMWQRAEVDLMTAHGADWTHADMAHCLGGSTERVCRYMADKIAATGQDPPPWHDLAVGFRDAMLAQLAADPPTPQPGVAALLAQVRDTGLPTALVSSSPRALMTAVLDAIGSHWFDATVSADDVDRFKPDPWPYIKGAQLIGVDPARCVAIEDSPTGAASALAAGAYVVAVQHLAPIEPGPRCTVVTTLAGMTVDRLAELVVQPGSGLSAR